MIGCLSTRSRVTGSVRISVMRAVSMSCLQRVVPRGAVDHAGAAWLAGPASCRGEHEGVHAVALMTFGAARGQIRAGVLGEPVPLASQWRGRGPRRWPWRLSFRYVGW